MKRLKMLICCAVIVLLCPFMSATSAESANQRLGRTFSDDELNAVWAAAWKKVNTVETLEEKVAVMKGFLEKYPESQRTPNAVNILFHYQGERQGDMAGAIAYVRELRAGLKDPRIAFAVDMELINAYSKAGDTEAFNKLADALKTSDFLKFSGRLVLIKDALDLEAWGTALAYAEDSKRFCTKEAVLKDYKIWNLTPEKLSTALNNRTGYVLLFEGWAKAKMGKLDEALSDFTEADKYLPRFYVGIPLSDLDTVWGLALLEKGSIDEAIEKLAPPALIMDDAKAMAGLRKAYAGKHGGDEGFEVFAREERKRLAKTIDAFELPDFDGKRHTLAQLMGKVTIVTAWNPGCGGCLEELPRLEVLWRKYKDRGLSVIAIETSMDKENALAFVNKKGLTFHLLVNERNNDVVFGTLGIISLPSSYIVDSDGRIMHFHYGFMEGDEKGIEEEILELLGS